MRHWINVTAGIAINGQILENNLKPRPYRLGEVAWDLVPLVGTFVGFAVYCGGMINRWEDFWFVVVWFAMIVPVAGGAWMQFSTSGMLERISPREWRESLALTKLDARTYLICQLKPRVVVQGIPFVAGALCVFTLPTYPILVGASWATETSELLLVFSMYIFSLLSMQMCGFCVGLIGLCSRLRRLCRPDRPDTMIVLTSVKWLIVTVATPTLTIIAGFYIGAIVMVQDKVTLFSEDFTMAAYFIVTGSLLNAVFIYGARRSWRKLIDEYYRFE